MKTFDLQGFVGIDILPQSVAEMLKDAGGDDITVNIHSIGGYVYDGFQIHNQIRDYPGQKTLTIQGIASSIAAYISTAFDKIIIRDNSVFMIHNAQGGAIGDYHTLEKEAKELKRLNSVIGAAYVRKSGRGIRDILQAMDEETWYYGKEIISAGFADEMQDSGKQSDRAAVLRQAHEKVAAFRPPVRPDDIQRAAALIDPIDAAGDRVRRASVTKARRLINSGDYDNTSSWSFTAADGNKMLGADGDDWDEFASWHMVENTNAAQETKARYKYPYGKNGKVYRSALRAIASRAAQSGLQELSDIASGLIDSIDEKEENSAVGGEYNRLGGTSMDLKTEVFEKLKVMVTNAQVTLLEIAGAMGLKHQVVTEEHTNALKHMGELEKLLGAKNVVETVTAMKTELDGGRDTVRNARLDSLFGEQDAEKKNELRFYMGKETAGLTGKALEDKINALKDQDPIVKRLMAERADNTSEFNTLGVVDHKGTNTDQGRKPGERGVYEL